jgi:hypothetical protein
MKVSRVFSILNKRSLEIMDGWPDQGYLPNNVNSCLLDSYNDTLGALVRRRPMWTMIGVVEQQDSHRKDDYSRANRQPLNYIAVGRNLGEVTQSVERMEVREGRIRVSEGK